MGESGYVPIRRDIIEWQWYTDPKTAHLFDYCMRKANWQDVKYKGIDLKRGQFMASYNTISEKTGLTIKEARTALKHLIQCGEVASKTTNKYSIITVLRYDYWQGMGKQEASPGQAEGRQGATDNKEKEFKTLEENSVQKAPSRAKEGANAKKNQFNQFSQSNYGIYGTEEELEKKLLSN